MSAEERTIEAVVRAVREWAMDKSYASWPAWHGEAERGFRFALREIVGHKLRAEDIQEYLDGTPARITVDSEGYIRRVAMSAPGTSEPSETP